MALSDQLTPSKDLSDEHKNVPQRRSHLSKSCERSRVSTYGRTNVRRKIRIVPQYLRTVLEGQPLANRCLWKAKKIAPKGIRNKKQTKKKIASARQSYQFFSFPLAVSRHVRIKTNYRISCLKFKEMNSNVEVVFTVFLQWYAGFVVEAVHVFSRVTNPFPSVVM